MVFSRGSLASLYGGSHLVDNPGKYQQINTPGSGPQQRPGTGIGGGAGCEHIVDQNETAARHFGLALGGHAKCALYVLGALGLRQADLLRGCLDAFQGGVGDLETAFLCDCLGAQR